MTLAYQQSGQKYPPNVEFYSAYITATGADTTTTATGKVIDNRDGSIRSIIAMSHVTDNLGNTPTLTLKLFGGNDGTVANFVQLQSTAAVNLASSALDISTASTTNVHAMLNTESLGGPLRNFPLGVAIKAVLGGTSTPGWSGTVDVMVIRDPRPRE